MSDAPPTDPVRWIDNHCHLGWDDAGADAAAAIADARTAGVERMITVGTDAARSAEAVAVATAHPGVVWATVGLHPHEARHGLHDVEALLKEADRCSAAAPTAPVVAVGECGLDYHYDHSPRDRQREMFAAQIALAHQSDLALVIHTREAWDDTFDILDAEGVPDRTVLHCFTGGPDEARGCLDRGLHISFSGIVTFRKAREVQEAAALCPTDRVLVETDSPYLAPVPHRGKPNRPALLPLVGAGVAEVRGVTAADVAAATWRNAAAVYRLPEAR